MKNYEKMVESNHQRNQNKIDLAVSEIQKMLDENLRVAVGELVKRTGLSRGFFYKNGEVRRALDRAQDLQSGKTFVKPQQVILDKAMEKQVLLVKRQLVNAQEENQTLKEENQRLQRALKKKELNFIKSL